MGDLLRQALRIMGRRKSVLWQLLAVFPAFGLAAALGLLLSALTRSAFVGATIGVLFAIFATLFVYGAALGAIGEAVTFAAPTPYLARGWRLVGRAAAYGLSVAVLGTAIMLVAGAVSAAVFGSPPQSAAAAADLPLLLSMTLRTAAVVLLLSIFAFPLLYGLAAALFAGRLGYRAAVYSAGQEYAHGHFPSWIAVWGVNVLLTLVYEGLYAVDISSLVAHPDSFGLVWFSVLGLVLIFLATAASWYATALAFALWRSHKKEDEAPPAAAL